MTEADAVYAFLAAFVVAALLTPLTARLARRVGAVDQPNERGLGAGSTPLLGGLAMLGGVLLSSAIFLDFGGATSDRLKGILAGAVVIAFVGALDDRFDLPPGAKLAGQSPTSRCRSSARSTSGTRAGRSRWPASSR
jgi:UDP-GlcNAc:undecaprenyl-phosphate GlcNAc-1-phosphate transferase